MHQRRAPGTRTTASTVNDDADVIEKWVKENTIEPRKLASWGIRNFRSFRYSRDSLTAGKQFISGVAYGAHTSVVNDADRVVLDMRSDADAGQRCELCTQLFKQPHPSHKGGDKCPSKHRRGQPAQAVHVQSGAAAELTREQKISYFKKLASRRSRNKRAKKNNLSQLRKPRLVELCQELGLSTVGVVAELRQRIQEHMTGSAASDPQGAADDSEAPPSRQRKQAAKKAAGKGTKKGASKQAAAPVPASSSQVPASSSQSAAASSSSRSASSGRKRKTVNYVESDAEEDDGSDYQEDATRWVCIYCSHPNPLAPGDADFEGCVLCGGLASGDDTEDEYVDD